MLIRATTLADVPAVMAIIEEARRTIAILGIDQWQNGSPNEAMILADVKAGLSRVAVVDGEVVPGREFTVRLSEKKLNFFYPASADYGVKKEI